ncbi:6-bladed beta-propeller [Luteolibacter algae]|uniref:6-bladed beta-propeller n=1 Tax=Luteolibacter algae TaxID=454151 RepID=A0ABW5D4A7_9BACT
MKPTLLSLFIASAFIGSASAHEYDFKKDFPTMPEGLEHIGDSHGEIDVDSNGLIYVSVAGGKKHGIQIYTADGKYLRNLPNSRNNHHGFTIVREDGKDFIYASCLGDSKTAALKLTTTGEIVMEIPLSALPAEEGAKGKDGKTKFALTHIDVAPNGDIYIIDGYSSDKIFIFDKAGNYKRRIGGKMKPWKFANAHKFAIDPRFEPARLLVCDRVNGRLVHLSLDGEVIGDFATNLRRPSAVDFHGDLVCVAEIAGRVTVLDKEGEIVSELGKNDDKKLINTNRTAPEKWEEGLTTAPHGISFDTNGDVITTEWNKWGRILRWDVKK